MAATTNLQEVATLASRVAIAPPIVVLAFRLQSPICSSRRWSATTAQSHVAAFALILLAKTPTCFRRRRVIALCLIIVAFVLFP